MKLFQNIRHKGKPVRIIGKFLYGLLFIALIAVASLVAVSTFNIPNNYKLLVVQSGSMEPAIQKGSVVLVKPQTTYAEGDVITISNPKNKKESVTHRVVAVEEENGSVAYTTKGDANNAADLEKRPGEQVLGKVHYSLPFVGYAVSYAKTKDGFIFIVLLPTILLIVNELLSIKTEVKNLIKKRKTNHD